MTVLSSNGVTPPVFHPIALALIAITAALAWRRVAAGKGWFTPDPKPKTASRKAAIRLNQKPLRKAGLGGLGGSQPLASRGFGR